MHSSAIPCLYIPRPLYKKTAVQNLAMFLTCFSCAKDQGVLKQFSGKAKKGVQTLSTNNGPKGKDCEILQFCIL